MAHVAYIRVSTVDQNTDRQLADVGIEFDKVFEDKASGKDTQRPQLQAMLEYVREGDTLHVHSIDRLSRSLEDLISSVKSLNAKGVAVKFHKENLEFTAEKSSPMNDLILNIFGAVAQFERALSKERQMEGIAKAKDKGVYNKERKKKVSYEEIYQRHVDGNKDGNKLSYRQLAKELGVGHGTVERAINACKPKEATTTA
ncbi:site-specific recombinase, DNA invertase Pin [Acinetobacter baumannii]|uniref:recombinase family protein n=1 Tax=Acinetobacter baumannii TaxID=470 RepID=UPI000DE5F71C|nr:recombinase family protein [Acinetobacter baumannii]SSQ11632.1 site-specific recombinase, DNA invertase Pin [Acinetobacter baumannii]SSQ41495.1 site-specific recombinase, DNA invertase Pin [Acinetobacter baumannii]HCC8383750.1 recombinase family protein [Acinetobacter baumannii]